MEKKIIDTSKLFLDTTNLNKNFLAYETEVEKINAFEHNDLINDWHIERIRRLNTTAEYLWLSLQRLNTIGEILTSFDNDSSQDAQCAMYIKNHRAACREVCINIDIYIESVKSFCRYYFFMDQERTDDTLIWYKTFEQYREMAEWKYIEGFLSACQKMFKSTDTQYLIRVRNKEVHNEPPLELINYKFQDKGLTPIPIEYVISNEKIHNIIVNVIDLLLFVTTSLQEVLNHISPEKVYHYLASKNCTLENIIKMEDRYKKEREYFKRFQYE